MAEFLKFVRRMKLDCRGQELVEYALIAGFLVAGCAAAIPDVSANVSTVFSKVAVMLDQSGSSDGSGAPRS
jgi:Flp pilus assembly pilin Flp